MVKKIIESKIEKSNILEHITANDAFAVLKILAEEDNSIRERIERIAKEYLSEVDLEDVASDVYFQLDSLEVEEVWDHSGRTRDGYVDPTDKAWEMFEEALEPFIQELHKYQKLSMNEKAKIYCIGILKGIYQFEKKSTSAFKDWAVDAPANFFDTVLDEWKKGQPDTKEIAEIEEFIKKNFPDW